MNDYFYEKIEFLLKKLNLNINYEIRKISDEYDYLYVTKEYNKIIFNINYDKVNRALVDVFLLHEIFHAMQYEQKFPMLILSEKKKKFDIIQKVITDLYNTEMMIKKGFFEESLILHNYRLKNAILNINDLDEVEDIYRVSYIIAENEIFFKNIENNLSDKLKKKFTNKKIKKIHQSIIDKYNKKDIVRMYLDLLKTMENNINFSCFDKNIIIL